VYTSAEREQIRAEILDAARNDPRITGGAITGSASQDREDAWSDIDLAFGLRAGAPLLDVVEDWTARMRDRYGALHTVDVTTGTWLYRVFLLPGTLQCDLAFAAETDFGARAPTFRLVFGRAAGTEHVKPPRADTHIGYAWLYALHVRSCLARKKYRQAENMLGQMRYRVLTMACLRLGLPTAEGRAFDLLPPDVTGPLDTSYVGRIEASEIARAFAIVTDALLREAAIADAALAERLRAPLREMSS